MDRKTYDKTYYETHKEEIRSSPARLAARQRYEAKRCARDKAARSAKRQARQTALIEKLRREYEERCASMMSFADGMEAREAEQRERRRQSQAEYYQRNKDEIRGNQAAYREKKELETPIGGW